MNDTNKPKSKICTGCDEDKPLEDFPKHKKGKYGHYYQCKVCKKGVNKSYYAANAEAVTSRVRSNQLANPELERERQRNKYLKRKASSNE